MYYSAGWWFAPDDYLRIKETDLFTMKLSVLLDPINLRRDVRDSLKGFLSTYLQPDAVVYDIGCGDKPFASFLKGKIKQYIGVDIEDGFYDSSKIDLIGTAYNVPVPNASASAIISSQVIEHLEAPLDALKESSRLLQPSGMLFISFPFMYPVHAAPHDFLRYTEFYMDKALEDYGFEIVEKKYIGGFWYCTGMFAGLYFGIINRGILRKLKLISLLIWFCQFITRLLHELEGVALKLAKKDKESFRQMWTVDYVMVCKKRETA